MAVRHILRMGNPLLNIPAAPVTTFNTTELRNLTHDLLDTMLTHHGIGLAAPQIGVGLQVIIVGMDNHPNYPHDKTIPLTILINPVLEPLGREMIDAWEGCLSVPEMRGVVRRYTHLRYSGRDIHGELITQREANGLLARVLQHECDHLAGILYPYRISDLRYFGFKAELFPNQPQD